MDNRFFRRITIGCEIEALGRDGSFLCKLENISLGGVFLSSKKPISPGDQVTIKLPLRNEFTVNSFAAKLTAIRCDDNGGAFTFNDLDPKNFWTLQSFINAST